MSSGKPVQRVVVVSCLLIHLFTCGPCPSLTSSWGRCCYCCSCCGLLLPMLQQGTCNLQLLFVFINNAWNMFALLRVFLCSMFFLRSLSSACKIIINCPAPAAPPTPHPPHTLLKPVSTGNKHENATHMRAWTYSERERQREREICMGSPHEPQITVKLRHRLAEAGSQRMHTIAITITISITVAFRY